ncbi:hypothetical protein XENTR_v10021797 [Xenopus tropicalis]|nr:hypothetical protein XENTR_v10021797 [Xenopus tropicalis]
MAHRHSMKQLHHVTDCVPLCPDVKSANDSLCKLKGLYRDYTSVTSVLASVKLTIYGPYHIHTHHNLLYVSGVWEETRVP